MVAALAFGILVLKFTGPFISVVNAQDTIEACHLSVGLASWKLNVPVLDFTVIDSPFKLNCKTLLTVITKDSINMANDKIALSKDNNDKNNQLKEAIMRNMRDCWYMYGEGKVRVYEKFEGTSDQTACLVCSEIIPDKDAALNPGKLTGMYSYAATEMAKTSGQKKYLDYFLEGADERPDIGAVTKTDKTMKLDKQYSVVFAVTSVKAGSSGLFSTFELGREAFERVSRGVAPKGVVDCYVGKDTVQGADAKAIGCKEDGTAPDSLIFGKVIYGGTELQLQNLLSLPAILPASAGANLLVGGSPVILKKYPVTVRLVPSRDIPTYCHRL